VGTRKSARKIVAIRAPAGYRADNLSRPKEPRIMKRLVLGCSALLLTALCAAPARDQVHHLPIHPLHHASMAAQMRVQAQLQREALKQQRALARLQQKAARQQMQMQKRLARALTPRLPRLKALARVQAPRALALRRPSRPRQGLLSKNLLLKSAMGMSGGSSAMRMPNGSFPSAAMRASSGLPSPSRMPPRGQAAKPPPPNPKKPAPPPPPALADQPVEAPVAVALAVPSSTAPVMHRARDLPMELEANAGKREPASFFLDSIAAPSETRNSSSRESAAMQLVSALAKGGGRLLGPAAPALELDLVRQTPPLPERQVKYFVSPLLVVD
jgi:hypothetical protein